MYKIHVNEIEHSYLLIKAIDRLRDAAKFTPEFARGGMIAKYIAEVSCIFESNKVVRGNVLYAVEKASKNFEHDARCIDILLSAIQHIEMNLWISNNSL